jgi:hypothetical protein
MAQINPNILFTYLSQLDTYREKSSKPASTEKLYLEKLIEFLKTYYASKNKKLKALLEYKKITFELFPIFFRSNSVIYIISINFGKSKYLLFNFEQMKTYNEKKYFELNYRYLTQDGKYFKETIITTKIQKFQNVIKIISLRIYFLKYHSEKQRIIEELIKLGRKSINLNGIHYRQYKE